MKITLDKFDLSTLIGVLERDVQDNYKLAADTKDGRDLDALAVQIEEENNLILKLWKLHNQLPKGRVYFMQKALRKIKGTIPDWMLGDAH